MDTQTDILNDAKTRYGKWIELFDEKIRTANNDADTRYWERERETFIAALNETSKPKPGRSGIAGAIVLAVFILSVSLNFAVVEHGNAKVRSACLLAGGSWKNVAWNGGNCSKDNSN